MWERGERERVIERGEGKGEVRGRPAGSGGGGEGDMRGRDLSREVMVRER